ncbi:MAG: ribonuclease HII [Chloroflexi bacterium]|nr:ribonuclease HII [Chloroflexota bacterium]
MKQIPTLVYEARFSQAGHRYIVGIDEVGRGAWAGPVVAGAVVLPIDRPDLSASLVGVSDSKICTPRQRENLFEKISRVAVTYAYASIPADVVDRIGIVPATKAAMWAALQGLGYTAAGPMLPEYRSRFPSVEAISQTFPAQHRAGLEVQPSAMLVDAIYLPMFSGPQLAIIDGDALCLSIAAASIIAKVARDRWMVEADQHFPGYGFARHKGYGTAEHREKLGLLQPCALHRFSFQPVVQLQLDLLP